MTATMTDKYEIAANVALADEAERYLASQGCQSLGLREQYVYREE